MRGRRSILGLAGAMIFTPFLLVAQQKQGPVNGCGAAPSCRGNGYWVLNGNAGGNVLLSVGASWDPGFHLGIVAPAGEPSQPPATQMFHLQGASLSPPPSPPTLLVPPPLPIPEPPKEPLKD
jgi:hypothetical protein